MKRLTCLGAAAALAFCIGSAFAAQDAVLMQVGKVQVTEADLTAELQRIPPQARAAALARSESAQAALKMLMARRLLAQEARTNGLAATPEVRALLKVNEERVLSEVRLLQADASNAPDDAVLEAYAREHYNAEPKRFEIAAQTRARHILIAGDSDEAKAQAEKLLADIKAGASFETVAQEHSQDPGSAKKGGDLGFFGEGRMVPEFDAALQPLQPGEVGGPFKTQFGWHLVQLVERRPAGKRPYAEVRDELRQEGRNRILSERRAAQVAKLLQGSEYNDEAIKAFVDKLQ
ncbi:peptidylprolyl isomerase [Pulveribacter sp.]|uniref:peptidylprolyl isomerase n=1 Tax=Pulveribacter sp. TaxID=2678893 RepID=UPI0028AAEE11|nr:peptidylprolyl isomerase [Pulveribacter sp.]